MPKNKAKVAGIEKVIAGLPNSPLESLTTANLADLYRAFKVSPRWQPLFRVFFQTSAKGLAKELLRFDADIAQIGLQKAAQKLLQNHAGVVHHKGVAIPKTGPLLIAINHPGLSDVLVLLSLLDRKDIRIIAAERSLLRALPNLCNHLIFLGDKLQLRLSSIREAKAHFNRGGCIVLFAKGSIESDPLIDSKVALESLEGWKESLNVFASLHPEVRLQAAIVKGVRHPVTFQNPLLRLQRDPKERDWLAATLQLMLKRYRQNPVEIYTSPLANQVENLIEEAREIVSVR
jgi:hypothetical protein